MERADEAEPRLRVGESDGQSPSAKTRYVMNDDHSSPGAPSLPVATPITRRGFGQAVGMAAVAGTLQALSADTVEAQARDSGRPTSSRPDDLCDLNAIELVARIRRKQVSAREVMTAHLARIERVNPKVNAIVTLVAERAMADAARADELTARGGPLGVLHGLPVAHKDLVDTAGIRTTRGSPFYRDNVPDARRADRDAHRARPAPSRAARPTRRSSAPDRRRSTACSARHAIRTTSPRPAVAAAAARPWRWPAGWCPIADGSDTGGSLRNPAAFCNVVGFRPSPGRVPGDSSTWSPLSVSGPMARSVADVALFLSAIAGPDPRSPLSIAEDGAPVSRAARARLQGRARGVVAGPRRHSVRAGDPARRSTPTGASSRASAASSRRRSPTSQGVDQAFPALRYAANHPQYAPLVRERPEWVKDTIEYEVAEAERMTAADIGRALARQARMYDQSRQFFERYDYFVLPVTQVAPFDVNVPYPDADRRHADGDLHRLDAVVLVRHVHVEPRDLGARRVHRQRACRSASRSSAATATTGACCRWPTPSSRPRSTGRSVPHWRARETHDVV